MGSVSGLVSRALNEVGYLEKASNASLDSKTGNAGYGNYTKYQRDLDNLSDFYNGRKQGYAWCDVFVDWCFVQEFGVTEALRLLGQPKKSMGAGCSYSASYYKAMNSFYTTPQVGDQIFFRNPGSSFAHTGLVVEVTGTTVTTVEGNTSVGSTVIDNGGGVCKKTYPINYSQIVGYGRPKYSDRAIVESVPPVKQVTVKVSQLKRGMKGETVKVWQALLNAKGYDCGKVDGDFGNTTWTKTKLWQANMGLGVDGIVGVASWSKMLGG